VNGSHKVTQKLIIWKITRKTTTSRLFLPWQKGTTPQPLPELVETQ
jgi:hypothetical protein